MEQITEHVEGLVQSGKTLQKRREFLRVFGALSGGMAFGALPGCGGGGGSQAETTGSVAMQKQMLAEEPFWEKIEDLFVVQPGNPVLDVDVGLAAPKVSREVLYAAKPQYLRSAAAQFTNLAAQRASIAPSFGVGADQIALTNGTSSGFAGVIFGLEWSRGEAIVTTNHEHPNTLKLLEVVRDFFGVELFYAKLPIGNNQTSSDIVNAVESTVSSAIQAGKKVKALVWSSPTYQTGVLLPIQKLSALARSYGAISICDGAHLPGMLSLDYSTLGVDYLTSSGHKWQCGPNSSGIVIAKRSNNGERPTVQWRSAQNQTAAEGKLAIAYDQSDLASQLSYTTADNSQRFESLAASVRLWDDIGRDKIESYIINLGRQLKILIADKWGADRLYSPKDDPALLSGLTTFNPFPIASDVQSKQKASAFVERLQAEFGFGVRLVKVPRADGKGDDYPIRIATPLWVNASDVEKLVKSMWTLAGKS